jgi:cbb3-type cytochrome oxidase subunit 3
VKAALLSQFPHLNLTVVAMLIFLATFLGWIAWTYRRSRKAHFDDLSHLPLED